MSFDINQNYFYMKHHCQPNDPKEFGLTKIGNNTYKSIKNDALYKERHLYDFGIGQETGYERMPELTFDDLIKLALQSNTEKTKLSIDEEESNKYGAIAIIMEKYILELINFLSKQVDNADFWKNNSYAENLKSFCFDKNKIPGFGGIGRRNYEDILEDYPEWVEISDKVKILVYKN